MIQPGTIVGGRYNVEAVIGHGGMGAIYRARDERLGRLVALKVLRSDLAADPAARARFLREGQIAAQMSHANVVRTYDAGDDAAGPYLVQELLSGRTLDLILPLSPQRAAQVMAGIAAALAYIHSRGYVHCDIKPQNILLKDDTTPVLLDFGIARAEGTDTTMLIATPHYLAPERARGEAPTVASDLYATGIVLFQAMAAHPPFEAPTIHAIIQQHIEQPVPSLGIAAPVGPILDQIIARLTAKRPEDRYPSADSLREDLLAVERGALHALPTMPMKAAPAPVPALQSSVRTGQAPAPMSIRMPQVSLQEVSRRSQAVVDAWSQAPASRKRRWLALILVPLVLLLVGYSIVKGDRAASGSSLGPDQRAVGTPVDLEGEPAATTQPAEAAIPEVAGLQYAAAALRLEQFGLRAQPGERRPDSQAEGVVLATEPAAGTTLPDGSVVLLHISAGMTPTEAAPPTEAVPPPAQELPPEAAPPPDAKPPADERGKKPKKEKEKGPGRDNDDRRGDDDDDDD